MHVLGRRTRYTIRHLCLCGGSGVSQTCKVHLACIKVREVEPTPSHTHPVLRRGRVIYLRYNAYGYRGHIVGHFMISALI